jgi:AcrR family transcriptional regulator
LVNGRRRYRRYAEAMARQVANPRHSYRQRRPSARREELRAVACQVFAEKGYAAGTMGDVAKAAGINSSSLYHHFATKDDILVETFEVFWAQILRDYRHAAERESPVAAMSELIQVAFDYLDRRRPEVTVMYNDWVRFTRMDKYRFVVARNTEAETVWVSVLRRGLDQGVFRADRDVVMFSRTILGAILSVVRWYDPAGQMGRQALAARYTELFLKGLRAAG